MIQRRLRLGLPQMEDVLKIMQEQQQCYAIWLYGIHTFTTVN